ncbi:hypothetical protein J4E90_009028 [Alternaria incomplexa]|uniref:uncharacterized protein n=1 Tax=Alternaria incomplexa TaxID=1187928 RepID=UPI00221E7995|nr:uncharacterized protein J4E90_009028 [Alternaria incomplexa]KAI4908403.1 hypothetical protein J4E90_009028 [Alternaria incomplexa]
MMGLSPLQVQPQSQPDQEQAAILTRIKQRSYTDPDNEGRFLYNLFVIQYFKSFQRNASEVELHLRHGGINEVKENVVQLQLSSDLTEEEMSFFPPFICVEHSVVCAWLQNSCIAHLLERLQTMAVGPALQTAITQFLVLC